MQKSFEISKWRIQIAVLKFFQDKEYLFISQLIKKIYECIFFFCIFNK